MVDSKMNQLAKYSTTKLAYDKKYPISCTIYPEKNIIDFYRLPTQSELQKWIRDVHKIHIEVNININSKWYFRAYDLTTKRCAEIPELYRAGENVEEDAFENALEIGLFETLKYIKL